MPKEARLAVNIAILVAFGGLAAWLVPISPASRPPDLMDQLQFMATLALFIERSVEIYLGTVEKNGPERVPLTVEEGHRPSAQREASLAAITLGLLIAFSGVRILPSMGISYSDAGPMIFNLMRAGIDIVISGALMAGGSLLVHEIAEAIKGSIRKVSRAAPAVSFIDDRHRASVAAVGMRAGVAPSKSYTIRISRPTGENVDEGTIDFSDGGVSVTAKCWWEKTNRIDAGVYTKCSKTHMATLNIEGIYLPEAVSKVTGAKEIFIHRGAGPENSKGCIAVETGSFNAIWNHIQPPNGRNVTVEVDDI